MTTSESHSGESPRVPGKRHVDYFEDHRVLQVILGRVESSRELDLLMPLLEELHRLLRGHFAREEAPDGLHGIVEEAAPHHLVHLQELMDQHQAFLERVMHLGESIRTTLDGPVAEIFRNVQSLCNDLQAHEHAETALLTETLYTDLGESS